MKLVYTRRYNIGFLGLERLHPFDSRKYGRAWRAVGREVRRLRERAWVDVPRPASDADLAVVQDLAALPGMTPQPPVAAELTCFSSSVGYARNGGTNAVVLRV